ncbi:MAG TPA: RNA-binding S4 domain-containing protein [Candidatus Binatia bacterium]|jgi:ribosome-associated heat shock protein Hsp15
MAEPGAPEPVRLDKWLWAARFFKTRSLAAHAIDAGHVKSRGSRIKAAHLVKIGESLSITIGPYTWNVTVTAVSAVRRGAPEARLLYEEDAASHDARQALVMALRANREAFQPAPGRPSKRDRRAIDRFRGR